MSSTIPADLLELKARFETWRTNRKYVREPILRGAPLGGESKRTFFAIFKLGCRKHTNDRRKAEKMLSLNSAILPAVAFHTEP